MEAVLFDLDETILDRSNSLKDFASWQARGMPRSEVRDDNFCHYGEECSEADVTSKVFQALPNMVKNAYRSQYSSSRPKQIGSTFVRKPR